MNKTLFAYALFAAFMTETAVAQSYYRLLRSTKGYESASKSYQVCGTANNTNSPISTNSINDFILSTAYVEDVYEVTTIEWTPGTVVQVPGNGKSPYWDAIYNGSGSKSEKIATFKKAVVGVGDTLAPLVYDYFVGNGRTKPKSWVEFRQRISEAAADIEFKTCVANQTKCIRANSWEPQVVTGENAARNKENLGYDPTVVVTEPTATTRVETKTQRSVIAQDVVKLGFSFKAQNLTLLPGECESFSIGYDPNNTQSPVSIPRGAVYNGLSVDDFNLEPVGNGFRASISVSGTGRKTVGLRNIISATLVGNKISVSKSNEYKAYLANREFASRCGINANFVVRGEVPHTCKDNEVRTLATQSATFNPSSASETISLSGWTLKEDEKAELEFDASITQGCPFVR